MTDKEILLALTEFLEGRTIENFDDQSDQNRAIQLVEWLYTSLDVLNMPVRND